MRRPRVLLADDHIATADLLRRLLQLYFDVMAVVEDGRALVSDAGLSPDVIVADISMPNLDGIDAAELIRRRDSHARIVFVTVHAEPILMERSLAAGALGYVLKDAAGDELVAAVHAVLGGHRYISRALRGGEGES
jgi:DNA-binding NarL/FixJ family response regulator